MTLIGKVAAALDAELGNDHESYSISMGCGIHAKQWRKEAMLKAAKAAIEAMREPTVTMVEDGWNSIGPAEDRDNIKDCYRSMIDAALKE